MNYIKGCPTCSDNELFQSMTNLLHTFSTGSLQNEADLFINRFSNRSGGDYFSPVVSNAIANTNRYKNFVKLFGQVVNDYLKDKNGNLNGFNVGNLNLDNARPIFNTYIQRLTGLQILVNDTEQTTAGLLDDFEVNHTTGVWSVTVSIDIIDHFGLDYLDAIVYQGFHSGFANWYRLQHGRNYIPFRSNFKILTKIQGNYKL